MQKVEEEKRIFLASLQDKTLVSLQGTFAQEAGFGVGMGLGYSRE